MSNMLGNTQKPTVQIGTFGFDGTRNQDRKTKRAYFFANAEGNTIFDITVKTIKENGIIWAFHQDKKRKFRNAVKETGCLA